MCSLCLAVMAPLLETVVVGALASASSAGAIPSHKQPLLEYVSTIAYDPAGNMRDPSPVVQDPVSGRWHFWVDWLPNATMDGWDAYQRHYSAADILGPWVNHGIALNHSADPTTWDSVGQVRLCCCSRFHGCGLCHHHESSSLHTSTHARARAMHAQTHAHTRTHTRTHTRAHVHTYHTYGAPTSSQALRCTTQSARRGGSSTRRQAPTNQRSQPTRRWCVLQARRTGLGPAEGLLRGQQGVLPLTGRRALKTRQTAVRVRRRAGMRGL